MTNQDTPTPRTDAEAGYFDDSGWWHFSLSGKVESDFARALERELTAANGYAESLRVECEAYSRKMLQQAGELTTARAEVEALRAALSVVLRDYAAVHCDGDLEMQPALFQARAALTKEKA